MFSATEYDESLERTGLWHRERAGSPSNRERARTPRRRWRLL